MSVQPRRIAGGFEDVALDENGRIVPEREDLEAVNREFRREHGGRLPVTDAECGRAWRLAQIRRLLRAAGHVEDRHGIWHPR
jgi:hypothetical protein